MGTTEFGEKLKTTITKHEAIDSNFDKFLGAVKATDTTFFEASQKCLASKSRILKHIIVTFEKGTLEEIDQKNAQLFKEREFAVWTVDQKYYFDKISDCTYDHCKYEIYDALGIEPPQVENESPEPDVHPFVAHGYSRTLEGGAEVYLLNFVVSVRTLLNRSKISRLAQASTKVGYQRLLDKDKLRRMRNYLLRKVPLYPNNIICVLDSNSGVIPFTKVVANKLELTDEYKAKTDIVNKSIRDDTFLVELSDTYRALEIVDGQHRLFSYAQSKYQEYERAKTTQEKAQLAEGDSKIKELAGNSNLNVTAIHSRGTWGDPGKLFLDINTTQTHIKPEDVIDLMAKYQEYEKDPKVSANRLLLQMNGRGRGVLRNKIKRKWWQTDKIKRTSLISYAGLESMFREPKKKKNSTYQVFRKAFESQNVVTDYVDFCEAIIEGFLFTLSELVKKKIGKDKFEGIDRDLTLQQYYLFSAVYIGALIKLLRHFLSDEDKRFDLLPKLQDAFVSWKSVIDAPTYGNPVEKLVALFAPGLEVIALGYEFTKKEFQEKGWASNRWAVIEAELYYCIKNGQADFGNEKLIAKKLRR